MDDRLVFINVGWMVSYQGPTNDPTLGGHGWLKTHDYGHEAWNYLPHEGNLYGYVPRSARINIDRLGAGIADEQLDDVTVVWIARNPRNKVTYVTGWYRGASIHRENRYFTVERPSGKTVEYQIQAPLAQAKLLAPDQRVMAVPTAKKRGNLGQSPVWYGNDDFVARVRSYLMSDGMKHSQTQSGGNSRSVMADPATRKLIEVTAVRHAISYYESNEGGNHKVSSVEKDNVGWDLTVTGEDVTLKVEVKGLSGRELSVELTPNEYTQMLSKQHRAMYVIYVVTEALSSTPKAHIFYYNAEASHGDRHIWNSVDGRILNIEQKTAARLTVK